VEDRVGFVFLIRKFPCSSWSLAVGVEIGVEFEEEGFKVDVL
jgi:hypothetical protein